MNNPFETINDRLTGIEQLLFELKQTMPIQQATTQIEDKYEAGIAVAVQELGLQPQSIYQQIRRIPHRKMFGKLYFNRRELREFLANGGLNRRP